ncbi:MAG: GxxExxY protein [Chloroflexi bacterium]|nr:GxxExxY protein [Chloroflexota bacterium]
MADLLHKELTGAIIGAFYEVYNHTSRTYPEYIYESALMNELQARGYETVRQDEYQIFYKERLVGIQRLDLFVVQEVVVENKVAERLVPLHKAQGMSYLKTVAKSVGLLFNFGSSKPEFDRLYLDPAKQDAPPLKNTQKLELSSDWLYPELAFQIVGGLYEIHSTLGPGFVHRIYANACYHELTLRGLAAAPAKRMQVIYKGNPIGDIAFKHLTIEGKVMVFPTAIRDIQGVRLDDLKMWMRANEIRLGILANFNTVHLDVTVIRA